MNVVVGPMLAVVVVVAATVQFQPAGDVSHKPGLVECYSKSPIITRISVQTAGLAFGGTGLCSYRVRGVYGSCAERLTVASHTVFICQQSYLLLFGIPLPTHSFIPGLKPSFSANSSHRSPSFFFFSIRYMDSPDCLLLVISEHICFLLLVFLFSAFYLSVPCGRLS